MPALRDDFGLRGEGWLGFDVGSVERKGDGVKGVEKGWAAEVDVAADGDWRVA